jgi:gamma-glutamylcyclotransferase (GGCT)/AIG2-like uncharacterized protein YtfP
MIPENFAFYGSLRIKEYNYKRILGDSSGTKYEGESKITGYKMYDLGPFPAIVETGDETDVVVVDKFHIPDFVNGQRIHSMEIGAGYEAKEIAIDNKNYTIYVYKDVPRYNRGTVPSGDWSAHTRN